jgi:alcohol dehydrogenase class IV
MGADALRGLKRQAASLALSKRVMIITDKGVALLTRRVVETLEDAGFQTMVWDRVVPEPPLENVLAGARAALEFNPGLLVAVGGGSVIDASKVVWILYESPETDIRQAQNRYPLGLRKKARLAAVPTTAGTGSEATNIAVVSDNNRKMFIIHNEIVPDLAVLDPSFTVGLPPKLTLYTGIDALSHATGAFLSHWSNEYLDALSLKAISIVFRYLPRAVENGHDYEARTKMLLAANMGGLAFSNSCPGLDHAMGHSLGKIFNVHHGAAVGLFLPYTMKYVCRVSDKYVELARSLGIEAGSDSGHLDRVVEKYLEFMKSLGAPVTIPDLGITREDFEGRLDDLCTLAYADNGAMLCTRPVNPGNFRRLFTCAFTGQKVDF